MKSLRHWVVTFVWLSCLMVNRAPAAEPVAPSTASERHFEMLKVGELNFTNVWVHRQTNFNILIRHSRGIHTIKLSDLPDHELAQLRSQIGDLADLAGTEKREPAQSLLARLKELLEGKHRPKVLAAAAALILILVLGVAAIIRRRDQAP